MLSRTDEAIVNPSHSLMTAKHRPYWHHARPHLSNNQFFDCFAVVRRTRDGGLARLGYQKIPHMHNGRDTARSYREIMNMGNPKDATLPLSPEFIRQVNDSWSLRYSSELPLSRQSNVGAKRFFVVHRIGWLAATDTTAAKRVERILIFDNHPDSLRLVSGYCRAIRDRNPSAPSRAHSWPLLGIGLLAIGVAVGMLWPLF
jgi:hypothetical protein